MKAPTPSAADERPRDCLDRKTPETLTEVVSHLALDLLGGGQAAQVAAQRGQHVRREGRRPLAQQQQPRVCPATQAPAPEPQAGVHGRRVVQQPARGMNQPKACSEAYTSRGSCQLTDLMCAIHTLRQFSPACPQCQLAPMHSQCPGLLPHTWRTWPLAQGRCACRYTGWRRIGADGNRC